MFTNFPVAMLMYHGHITLTEVADLSGCQTFQHTGM